MRKRLTERLRGIRSQRYFPKRTFTSLHVYPSDGGVFKSGEENDSGVTWDDLRNDRSGQGYCVNLERYISNWRAKFEDVLPCPVFVSISLRTRPLPAFRRPSPSGRLGKPTALRKPVAHALFRTGDEFDRVAARSDACVRRARFVTLASPKNQYGWPAWPRARSNIYVLGLLPPAPAAARFLRSSIAAHH